MRNWKCSWVPGTMNRVHIKCDTSTVETTVEQLVRAFGTPVLSDLYLRGRAIITTERDLQAVFA